MTGWTDYVLPFNPKKVPFNRLLFATRNRNKRLKSKTFSALNFSNNDLFLRLERGERTMRMDRSLNHNKALDIFLFITSYFGNKTPATHRDIFRQKLNASAQVRTHDLVSVRRTHYQLCHGD